VSGDPGDIAKLRAAFELSPAILSITGLDDGRLLEVNDAFCRLSGYTRDDVLGRPMGELNLWVDPAQRDAGLARLRAGQAVRDTEIRLRTKAGAEIVAIANADVVVIEGRRCILTALTDITARVRAEAALRESERRFAQAFHANPLPMSITRLADGRHLDVNDAAIRHSGYTREQLLGRTKAELGFWVAPEERERMIERLRRDGRARDVEVVFRTRSGEHRQLLVNSEVVIYLGEPAVLSVSLDITERKQEERAKDEFLAMLGHELRNPLGTITNALGVLSRLAGDDLRRPAEIIGRQTAHLTRLVDDLLDVSRLTSGKIDLRLQPTDLGELASRCLEALAQAGRTREHRMSLQAGSARVLGDAARLEQVITNLLDNALKYTPAGGEVHVRTGYDGGEAILAVRDTGEGISAELRPRIFDLFVQESQSLDRARGGLGLGLTLVKRLVERHGGSVGVTSDGRGLGSEFTIRLPALGDTARRNAAAPHPARIGGPCRVLIVEDNADARESLREMLELVGHEVSVAEDGPRGLELLRAVGPDVALVDVGLPGMYGY
jgi:two-component system CheB/CheR fusion protein